MKMIAVAPHHRFVQPMLASYISFGVGCYCFIHTTRQCEKPEKKDKADIVPTPYFLICFLLGIGWRNFLNMGNNLDVLRSITKGNAFTLKFEKTLIYRVQNGKETLIDSFYHSDSDDYYATFERISNRYGGGLCTSLTFNKFERLQYNGLFKELYNGFDFLLLPDDWKWHKVNGGFDLIEYPVYSNNFVSLCVYTSENDELGMLLFIDDGYSICYKIAFTRPKHIFASEHS